MTTVEDRKNKKAAASARKTGKKKAAASASRTDQDEVAEGIELSEYEKYVAERRKRNEEHLRKLGLLSASKTLTVQKQGKKKRCNQSY